MKCRTTGSVVIELTFRSRLNYVYFGGCIVPKTLKMIFCTVCLLGVQHQRDTGDEKQVSLLIVSLSKAFNEVLFSL